MKFSKSPKEEETPSFELPQQFSSIVADEEYSENAKEMNNASNESDMDGNNPDDELAFRSSSRSLERQNPTSSVPFNAVGAIRRKIILLLPLLLCLYLLTDDDFHVPFEGQTTPSNSSSTGGMSVSNNSSIMPESESYANYDGNPQPVESHHLAFVTALSRHPPSLRVFRVIFQSSFLLLCTAFALSVWEFRAGADDTRHHGNVGTDDDFDGNSNLNGSQPLCLQNGQGVGRSIVGRLLFAPPPDSIATNAAYLAYKKSRPELRRRLRGRFKNAFNGRMTNKSKGRWGSRGTAEQNKQISDDHGELQPEWNQPQYQDIDPDGTGVHKYSTSMRQMSNEDADSSHATSSHRGSCILDGDDTTQADDLEYDTLAESLREGGDLLSGNTPDRSSLTIASTAQSPIRAPQTKHMTEMAQSTHNPIPPTSSSVLGVALDVLIFTSIFLIFFTISSAEGGRYIDRQKTNPKLSITWMNFFADITAPLFPLSLFAMSLVMVLVPWKKRKVLWTIVSLTIGAPFYSVTFRDGFVGDILTSTVRPLQDLAYTFFFLPLGVQAWWSNAYNIDDTTATPLERSWILHTVLLPACTISPLWWRFLQNLRQCFDSKQRWPHLGNAFKYLLAAEVAIFGMFDPSVKRHPVWITCFFCATLYQVWWDIFMDWGLLQWVDYREEYILGSHKPKWCLLCFPYKLRSQQLYPRQWIYYAISIINFLLRFVGMITLIPPVHLSRTTGLIVNTYDPEFQMMAGSVAASAEIFRRTIWALLRLEWEVIKMDDQKKRDAFVSSSCYDDNYGNKALIHENDMKPMAIQSSYPSAVSPHHMKKPSLNLASLSDMSDMNDIQILSELCVWATMFSGIAIIAAAHREIL